MQGKYKGNITWVDNTRFSVSRDNNLIAVHNLSEYNMRRVIDMGALVMPSIAITNTKIGHTSFGDISLLFGKDTIDPSDRRNKVYGGDAWTPRFPHLEPKINESVAKDFIKKIEELLSDTRLRDLYHISSEVHESNISDNIRNGGVERYYNKEFMKHAYLLDKGKKVKVPMMHKDYGEYSDTIIDLVKAKGLSLSGLYNTAYDVYRDNKDFVNELHERIIDIKVSSMSISEVEKEKVRGLLRKEGMSFAYFDRLVKDAFFKERDLKYGQEEIVDRKALLDDINSRVSSNNANYRKWVNDLFDGIIEKYGIRNNKDWYTPSGMLRSWETLYDNVTPSNILKHMLSKSQQGGQGIFNSSIFGASAEEYSSIEEIRERGKERLQKEDEEVCEEWNNSVLNRLSDIRREVESSDSSFGDSMDFNQRIIDAVSKKKIASGIYKEVKRFYPKFTMSHAKQVEDIVKEIQAHAIGYFEAKPQRIISLDEVVKAVVPTGTSADVIDGLKGYGIDVVTYRRGNDNAHKRAIERASKDIRFSFIGEKGASNLDKAEEATIRLDNLAVAREMEKAKKDAKTIKLATGWERGADGMWRYEVEDDIKIDLSANVDYRRRHPEYARYEELRKKAFAEAFGIGEPMTEEERKEYDSAKTIFSGELHGSRKLKDYVETDSLFKSYPELATYKLNIVDEMENGASGSFDHDAETITLKKSLKAGEMERALVHELQHAIQDIEGFAVGGDIRSSSKKIAEVMNVIGAPNGISYNDIVSYLENGMETRQQHEQLLAMAKANGYDNVVDYVNSLNPYGYYHRLSGEVEARNVVKRMGMTAERRRQLLAEETEDVSRKDQIFLYDGLVSEMRFSKKYNRDNIAEVVYRNKMIIDYNRYVFENRPRGILKPHYGYIDEDRLEEYKAFYQDIKNKAEDLKSYLKEVIMTDATSGAKSFLNEYIAKKDREVDAYRRLSENDNSVLNEYLRFSRKRGSLTKETVEKGFGGIWIADKQEYAKFVSAVNQCIFEEDGEGVAYTDNYFYAYYWNIDGEPIPFASVHLNAEDSQDVVNQITQDIKDGRKKGIRDFVDRANELAWNIQSKNDVISGNDKSQSNTRRANSLDSDIQRKGRYFDRPDLYVKTQRTDRRDRQTKTDYSRGRERGDIDDTRFSRKMSEAKAQLEDMKYGETVRMDALAQAKAMFLQGEPMEDIFAQTGWKQQNVFGKPTWIYTEPELSAREKLDRFLKADRKSEIEMLTLGNKKLSELRAMLGDTINMKTFKSKLKEIGKSEEEVREDLADFVL